MTTTQFEPDSPEDVRNNIIRLINSLGSASDIYSHERVGVVTEVESSGDYGNILIQYIDSES